MLDQWAGAGGEAGTEEPETEAALPTYTAEEVRENGTLIATETVALTEAPGYSGGKAWFLSDGGALAVDGIAPRRDDAAADDAAGRRPPPRPSSLSPATPTTP